MSEAQPEAAKFLLLLKAQRLARKSRAKYNLKFTSTTIIAHLTLRPPQGCRYIRLHIIIRKLQVCRKMTNPYWMCQSICSSQGAPWPSRHSFNWWHSRWWRSSRSLLAFSAFSSSYLSWLIIKCDYTCWAEKRKWVISPTPRTVQKFADKPTEPCKSQIWLPVCTFVRVWGGFLEYIIITKLPTKQSQLNIVQGAHQHIII